MSQIVGQSCSMCSERIGNAFESAFCEKCGNPVHNRCRVPSASAPSATCPVCGSDLAAAARRAAEQEQKERKQEAMLPPPPPLEIERAYNFYRAARLYGGAAGVVLIGILCLTLDEPGATAAGIGAIIAGVGLGVFGALNARR